MKEIILILIFLSFISCNSEDNPFGDRINQGKLSNSDIDEASGIASSKINKGILWVHNDSGDKSRIFAISINGEILGEIKLEGISAFDWEDICIGPGPEVNSSYIYIGDIGDNAEIKKVKSILRLKEPIINLSNGYFNEKTSEFDKIEFVYPDKIHDSEALFIDPISKNLYLISKRTPFAQLYQLPYPQSINEVNTAKYLSTLSIGEARTRSQISRICAADISNDGAEILVKSYDSVYYFKREPNESIDNALQKSAIGIKYIMEPQGEAICFASDNSGFFTLSEESPLKISQNLYFYPRIGSGFLENIFSGEFNVMVNSTKKYIEIELVLENDDNAKISLLDSTGKYLDLIADRLLKKGKNFIEYDQKLLASGVYFILVDINKSRLTKKILVIN